MVPPSPKTALFSFPSVPSRSYISDRFHRSRSDKKNHQTAQSGERYYYWVQRPIPCITIYLFGWYDTLLIVCVRKMKLPQEVYHQEPVFGPIRPRFGHSPDFRRFIRWIRGSTASCSFDICPAPVWECFCHPSIVQPFWSDRFIPFRHCASWTFVRPSDLMSQSPEERQAVLISRFISPLHVSPA